MPHGVLDGKVAVVTDGAGGIGRATAHRMAAEGASVVVIDVEGATTDKRGIRCTGGSLTLIRGKSD
jgi:NAD(P)-dependent dehydrogenase (short-subunit alcohol dehydrogenase family)